MTVELPEWQKRLLEEHDELLERRNKLESFLIGGFMKDAKLFHLMIDQLQAMDDYLDCVIKRMAYLKLIG